MEPFIVYSSLGVLLVDELFAVLYKDFTLSVATYWLTEQVVNRCKVIYFGSIDALNAGGDAID